MAIPHLLPSKDREDEMVMRVAAKEHPGAPQEPLHLKEERDREKGDIESVSERERERRTPLAFF